MAHSIRAMTAEFNERQIGLHVVIDPVAGKWLHRGHSSRTPVSLLNIKYYRYQIVPYPKGLIHATIRVNQEANRQAARLCIAHELFHLYLQLLKFEASGYNNWPNNPPTPDPIEEYACDAFAWDLCRQHHEFYWDNTRLDSCRFGLKDFPDGPLRISLEAADKWPLPFQLGTGTPFTTPLPPLVRSVS